ncbi:YihY family inner membrane protein [Rhodovulum adriaticum]|uniref:UPF0761 membrane protein EV656_11455 n=1 Tax=Rhodovulum adriaticum TaxID=35804 RepID=A0A4V2SKV5_RHOAD|nr:YihY family inner membrane protein [Rhodovulum adriaticum]MBK1635798.1 hypothetical protein [Rhodovulum adriaticum]TCP21036.1 tRNA-processing RNAse BN [Rhodovulum adriaticum]
MSGKTRFTDWPALRAVADLGHFIRFALRRFRSDGLTLAAGALTYSTLLALVPLMVIMLAILSGFPAFESVATRIETFLLGILVPEAGAELSTHIATFAANARNLTTFGVVGLAVTAVLLLSTIETTLNRIWRVDRARPPVLRLLIFWAILTAGPLLLAASFTLTSDLMGAAARWAGDGPVPEPQGLTATLARRGLAILGQIAFLTLLFKLVPARPVRLRHATLGGAISGLSFEVLRIGFNAFLTSGSTYATIYGALAAIPIFLVWLYLSWSVIIFGALFAAAFPDWWHSRGAADAGPATPARRLDIAMGMLGQLARNDGVSNAEALADIAPLGTGEAVLETLLAKGYVVATEAGGIGLTRDLHRTQIRQLAQDLNLSLGQTAGAGAPQAGGLAALLDRLAGAEAEILNQPIADLLPAPERRNDETARAVSPPIPKAG